MTLRVWLPILPWGNADFFYLGLDGNFLRSADGAALTSFGRFNPFYEPSDPADYDGTMGRLVSSTFKNTLAAFVTADNLPAWEELSPTTDRPLPEGVRLRLLCYSLLDNGSWFMGTLSSLGWAPEIPDRVLDTGLSLMVGIECDAGAALPATALSIGRPQPNQALKVYLPPMPATTYGAWADMVFLSLTGQPVLSGSGALTGASLADTQSTPSRKAVIIGA